MGLEVGFLGFRPNKQISNKSNYQKSLKFYICDNMKLKDIMLSEICQAEAERYYMISLAYEI